MREAITSTLLAFACIADGAPNSFAKRRISASSSIGAGGALGRGYGGTFAGGDTFLDFGKPGALHFGAESPSAGGVLYGALGRLSSAVPAFGLPRATPSVSKRGGGGGAFPV